MSAKLHATLCDHLEQIAALYKVRPRITLIVRMPGAPEQGVFLSDDSWPDAVAAVAYLQGHAAYVAGPPEPQPGMDWSGTTGTVMPAQPSRPAQDAVREAAERLRQEREARRLGYSGTGQVETATEALLAALAKEGA